MESDRLLRLREVAAELRCSASALYGGKLRHQLRWINVNGRLRLPASELVAFLDGCRERPAA
jgi:hypothetical protein